MSAKSGEGIEELISMINSKLFEDWLSVKLLVPYSEGRIENELRNSALTDSVEYRKEGIYIKCSIGKRLLGRYREYIID